MMTERPVCRLNKILLIFVWLFASFRVASTAAIESSSSNVTFTNLTSATSNSCHCTSNKNWVGAGSSWQECSAAIKLLYDIDVTLFGAKDLEFISARAKPRLPEWVRTPRKYTFRESMFAQCRALHQILISKGKCTVAIVMLNVFPQGTIPGAEEGTFPSRDVASFYELYTIVNQIFQTCLLNQALPGWGVAGESATGFLLSQVDRARAYDGRV